MNKKELFEPQRKDFEEIIDHGFKEPEIKKEDYYYLGATKIPDEIIKPGGQYLNDLPVFEKQKKGVETYGCTGFGTLNAREIIEIVKYQEEFNWSDRCINILANNTQNGNSPERPAEVLRKRGVCFEETLPYPESVSSWAEFHDRSLITPQVIKECRAHLDKYEFLHEWINAVPARLMEGLERSPIGVSVKAWKYRNGMYWKYKGESDNHWCVLAGYEKGKCWYILDTYDNYIKKLEWDYDFKFAKKYYLKKKIQEIPKPINNDTIMKTLKQETDKRVYGISNTDPNTIFWIGGPEGDDTYTFLKKHGLVNPSVDVVIKDGLINNYKIESGIVKLDHDIEEESVNWFSTLIERIKSKKK